MKIIAETERLLIRRLEVRDYEGLYDLDSDPDVMRYISDGKPMSAEAVRSVLEKIIGRYEEGKVYGVWAAEVKTSGEFIGWFALKPLPGTSEIEIGYRLLKKYWGKGYATEGAKELLRYGTEILGLRKIVAIANPKNQASKNVLEKVGLKYIGDHHYQSSPESEKVLVSWFSRDFELSH
jgi:RimJ/RimL family protein N-acetyltransferase